MEEKGTVREKKYQTPKVALQQKIYDELKGYNEYSGVPMATALTRLWLKSEERKEYLDFLYLND